MKPRGTTPRIAVWLGLWAALAPAAWAQSISTPLEPSAPVALSPVILTENPDAVQRFAVNSAMAREMVDRAILKLTSAQDIGTAWKRLGVKPDDVIGIKITTMGGPALSTHQPIVQAICDGLQEAGLSPSHIIIWDKFQDDMVRAGYTPVRPTASHVGIASVFPGTGYDTSTLYKNELIGTLIWGDYDFIRHDTVDDLAEAARDAVNNKGFGGTAPVDSLDASSGSQTSNNSYFASLVTRICTKIINVPVLTDNSAIGINGCLGSLALSCVDNNRRFQNEPTFGDPAICEILDKDFMRHKVIIHILDAMVAEYAGGPLFNPIFTKQIGAIYVSRDPVAIDSLVLPRLEAWRRAARIDPIGKTASHVKDAASYNLGTNDPGRIQLVKLP